MPLFEIGDKVLVLVGIFINKQGVVRALSKETPDVPKCIGVSIVGSKTGLVWFRTKEIQIIEEG